MAGGMWWRPGRTAGDTPLTGRLLRLGETPGEKPQVRNLVAID